MSGDLKVSAKVTDYYTMQASKIGIKEAPKSPATPKKKWPAGTPPIAIASPALLERMRRKACGNRDHHARSPRDATERPR